MNATVGSYPDIYSEIFLAQKNVIFELAKSPCIIVGRCADFVLQEAGIPSFDIYLYADIEKRRQRASELEEAKGKNLDKYIAKRDAADANTSMPANRPLCGRENPSSPPVSQS